jgi:hypothetical protein
MKIPPGTYRGHENGERGFRFPKAERYGRFFGVNTDWLLYNRGPRERGKKVEDEAEDLPPEFRQQALDYIEFLKQKAREQSR